MSGGTAEGRGPRSGPAAGHGGSRMGWRLLSGPFTALVLVGLVGCGGAGTDAGTAPEERFDIVEATIPEMQQAMEEGRVTSRGLVEAYLMRIGMYEERVNATISVNAHALEEADRLDRERAEGRVRGPLHGIPVALKDNVHTTDIPTTSPPAVRMYSASAGVS